MPTLKINSEVKIDRSLFFSVIILTIFGILMVFEASSVTAFRDFGDKYVYVKQQAISAFIGFILLLFLSKFDYQKLAKFAPILFIITIITLLVVLIPGIGLKVLGARRWINLGFTTFQPAELAKLTLIIYFSSIFSKETNLLKFASVLGLIVGLTMLEPDLGTTIIISLSSFLLFFVAGANIIHLGITSLVSGLLGILLIFSSSYRRERFFTFLDWSKDVLGASYHIRQILLALGSGGLFGVGLGVSRQKYSYLPEAMTDSIFAIIAEELGFIGAFILLSLFLFIFYRGIKIAMNNENKFGSLLACGITSILAVQTFLNLSSMVALTPLTGVPLPFISFGGSSLIVHLSAVGILLNISKSSKVKTNEPSRKMLRLVRK